MTLKTPIRLISWDSDFIAALGWHLLERAQGDFSNHVVVFPHRRPRRYLAKWLAENPAVAKPLVLPRLLSFGEWTAGLRESAGWRARLIEPLDQVCLLRQAVLGLQELAGEPLFALAYDLGRFFPWGLRLAGLLEELFRQNLPVQDIHNLEDSVLPAAAAMLANLRKISEAYRAILAEQSLTTPGLSLALLAENLETVAAKQLGKRLFFCGFYALSGAEDALLRHFWQTGQAEILWHSDPNLAAGRAGFAAKLHGNWLREWGAELDFVPESAPRPEPLTRFYQGFDLHSQLKALQDELETGQDESSAAVVLPDTAMLMPVLHHLPRRDVNISMGYPLWRSPLYSLLDTLLRLQSTRAETGYYWRDVVHLIRHPYLKMLWLNGRHPLREIFHALEEELREGGKYVNPLAFSPDYPNLLPDQDPQAVAGLLQAALAACFTAFERVATLKDLAGAVDSLLDLLLDARYRGDIWERFVIDAQCLYRLKAEVLPQLALSLLAREELPREGIFSVLREVLRQERTPFEAEPLSGLQVLGWLETRLLSFRKLYILDATENMLPGPAPQDPLLPDPLRALLGLPDVKERDSVAAHNFFRLLAGSSERHIFYQTGSSGSGLLEDKSVRSRFVEILLWEIEKKEKVLLKPGEPPEIALSFPVRPLPAPGPGTPLTPALAASLAARLGKGKISATFLDTYLKCPQSFFFQYVAKLKTIEEVSEEGDSLIVGNIIHKVLEDYFRPLRGRALSARDIDLEALLASYQRYFAPGAFPGPISAEAALLLESAGRERLKRYARNFQPSTPLEFEREVAAILSLHGRQYGFIGKIDRIDRRESGLFILDYKTGRPRLPRQDFWDDAGLFARLSAWDPECGDDPLDDLSAALGSLQLPLYALLLGLGEGRWPGGAAFVELSQDGQEVPLFEPEESLERLRALEELLPPVLDFLLRRMSQAAHFNPVQGSHCAWCAFAGACEARRFGER